MMSISHNKYGPIEAILESTESKTVELFWLSFRSIFRILFIFMASNEDLNMKVKRVKTFLYFTFLIFYLQYILVGI